MIHLEDSTFAHIGSTPRQFLFRRRGSLKPLFKLYQQRQDPEAKRILDCFQRNPQLLEPFESSTDLQLDGHELECFMSALFPAALGDRAVGLVIPFSLDVLYATPSFHQRFVAGELDDGPLEAIRNQVAVRMIMQSVYGFGGSQGRNNYLACERTYGSQRYLEIRFDSRFVEVEFEGQASSDCPLSLLEMDQAEQRLALLKPERFSFSGFVLMELVDVTETEAVSRIRLHLSDRNSLLDSRLFVRVEQELQTMLGLPDLHLGLGVVRDNHLYLFKAAFLGGRAGLEGLTALPLDEFDSPKSRQIFQQRRPLVQPDVTSADGLPEKMAGVRSLLVLPVERDGDLTGIVELTSATRLALNSFTIERLQQLLPAFAMAFERTNDELDRRVGSVLKTQFTAIHPAVEWRFRQAAVNFLQRGDQAQMEEIVFEDVYPLLGVSDIRRSNAFRSQAVANDLAAGVRLAEQALVAAAGEKPLAFLDERRFRLRNWLARLEEGIGPGEELECCEFLSGTIEPILKRLRAFGPASQQAVEKYFSALDPERGRVYKHLKDYDESVTTIRDEIARLLTVEQAKAQALFPHYFELQKTDGIDHFAFIGSSLSKDNEFAPLYLKNLRLWQLMVLCVAARKTAQLEQQLPVPLETNHLLATRQEPVTIRFLQQEKQFGIDGEFQQRFLEMRRVLNRARLTQDSQSLGRPGTVSIVYSRPSEALEYREYISYLHSIGYVTHHLEEFELAPLEGIRGLKGLRVEVAPEVGLTGTTIERTLKSLT